MYQSPTLYGKRVTLLFIGITCLGIILCVAAGTNSVIGSMGAALFLGVMTAALVIDWSGVITLRGLTDWSHLHGKKRFWLIVAWVFLFPVFFCIYLVRVAMHQFSSSALPSPAPAPKKVRVGLVIGSLVVCIGLISAFGSANGATANPTARVVVAATPTDTPSLAQNTSTQIPTATRPTPTYQVQPTPTSTSVPTQPPAPPTPKPTTNPCPNAVNGNPWCYDFNSGRFIYNPPANFCDYFNCIAGFWNGRGYVEECQDETYSKSGGIQGSCSHHGGNLRPLYSH